MQYFVCVSFRIQGLKKEATVPYTQCWFSKEIRVHILPILWKFLFQTSHVSSLFSTGLISSVVKYKNNICSIGLLEFNRLLYKKGPIRCLKHSLSQN